MVSRQLLDYVNRQKAKGHQDRHIKAMLAKHGYLKHEIEAAFSPPKRINPKYIVFGIVLFLILIVAVAITLLPENIPSSCGDGVVNPGENPATCCLDAGCDGQKICMENACVESDCGYCEYKENDVCKEYECCSNDMCKEDLRCDVVRHQCVEVSCDYCQYAINHTCMDYACCSDSECDDDILNTTDRCSNKGTVNARCDNVFTGTPVDVPVTGSVITNKPIKYDFKGETIQFNFDQITDDYVLLDVLNVSYFIRAGDFVLLNFDDALYDVKFTFVQARDGFAEVIIDDLSYACFKNSDCDGYCVYSGTPLSYCAGCLRSSDCDDGDSSTKEYCKGSPGRCVYEPIVDCIDNDGFCPAGCTNVSDNSCGLVCQDDQDCYDNNSSTKDRCLQGICSNKLIDACKSGDGYCPDGCMGMDDDCGNVLVGCRDSFVSGSYVLNDSITFSDVCMFVDSDDVRINCQSHSIKGNGSAIYVMGRNNVSVENCVFDGSEVVYLQSTHIAILRNQFIRSYTPIQVFDSRFATVSYNTLFGGRAVSIQGGESYDFAIHLRNSQYANIDYNTVTSLGYGVYVDHSFFNNITHNTVDDSFKGFGLLYSDNNRLMRNNVSFSYAHGLYMVDSYDNIIGYNRAYDAGLDSIMLPNNTDVLNKWT